MNDYRGYCFVSVIHARFMITDQNEEEGCWHLALWVLQEDSCWRRLDVQVGLHLHLAVILPSSFTLKPVTHTQLVAVDMFIFNIKRHSILKEVSPGVTKLLPTIMLYSSLV